MKRFLIVGGDGVIGYALNDAISSHAGAATCTTRRRKRVSQDRPFLDLQDAASVGGFDVSAYRIAYICAGVSKYSDVETNAAASYDINVTNTLLLCSRLMKAGCSVVFLSTAAVFDGEHLYPDEADLPGPNTRYGRQKYQVEQGLIDLQRRLDAPVMIVRLTKVMPPDMPLLQGWRDALARGETISPFVDLKLSPVSLSFAVAGLLRIGALDRSGIFHLSGKSDVSYADIARELLPRWGYAPDSMYEISSQDSGVLLSYKPKFPSLGMTMTGRLAGIAPQPFEDCIADLTG